jgi:DNA-binding NarL/FixJ family response regulator
MPTQRKKRSGVVPGSSIRSPVPAGEEEQTRPVPPGRTRATRSAVLLDADPGWLRMVEQTLAGLGVEVVGTAEEPSGALDLIREREPDLLVIDTRARGREMDSLACLRRARAEAPQLKVIVLSDRDDHEHIEAALQAGASAYLAKPKNPDDFATAIRQVFERSIFPAVNAGRPEGSARAAVVDDSAGLTQRELEVLRHVAEGRSNAQVGRILWVTEPTIKFHLSNIYRKLGVANRTQACRRAQTLGLLSDSLEVGSDRSVRIA